jgi:hypothetical protein
LNGLDKEWDEESSPLDQFTAENVMKAKEIIAPPDESPQVDNHIEKGKN